MRLDALMLEGQTNFKETELERYALAHRQQVIAAIENGWDKYRVTLRNIEAERDAAAKQLDTFLKGVRYSGSGLDEAHQKLISQGF